MKNIDLWKLIVGYYYLKWWIICWVFNEGVGK